MKKILIVDDDPRIVAALAIRLDAAGYGLLTAADGREALKLARQHRPDLILLDIGLPLMDIYMPLGVGYSVASRLKTQGLADIPVIFLTASKQKELPEAARSIGAAGFFEKPYDADELLAKIANILGASHSKLSENTSAAQPEQAEGAAPPRQLQTTNELYSI